MLRTCLMVLACVVVIQAAEPIQPVTVVNPKPKQSDLSDQIDISSQTDQVLIELTKVAGISQIEVTRQTKQWPKQLVIRFHLSGLEQLTITHHDWVYRVSVMSHSGYKQRGEYEQNKKAEQLDQKDPRWLEVRRLNKQGQSINGLPNVKDGDYFEIILPKSLLSDESDKIGLGWIDFYR